MPQPPRQIALINQKGGVGKTTTTANLGAALARAGRRVLLIDCDPQSHLTMHLGVEPGDERGSIYEVLTDARPLAEVVLPTALDGVRIVPSTIDLAAAEVELVGVVGREVLLRDALAALLPSPQGRPGGAPSESQLPYDYVLIDCPPSLGLLTLNALSAASEVLICLQPHFLALQGVGKLLETVALVQQRINPALAVTGVVLCMYELGTRLAGEVADDLARFLADYRGGQTPWAAARIFRTIVRRNIKLAECPSFGQVIFQYAPASHGAEDYARLADEVIAMESPPSAPPPATPLAVSRDAGGPDESPAPPAHTAHDAPQESDAHDIQPDRRPEPGSPIARHSDWGSPSTPGPPGAESTAV